LKQLKSLIEAIKNLKQEEAEEHRRRRKRTQSIPPPISSSTNDLRDGELILIEERGRHPLSGEITFSPDHEFPMWMSWRYREPRVISKLVIAPLPDLSLSNPRLYLRRWDDIQEKYFIVDTVHLKTE